MKINKSIVSGLIAISVFGAGSLTAFAGYESHFYAPKSEYEAMVKTSGNYYYLAAATDAYNCLGYALGDTNHWVWPWGGSNPTLQQANNYMTSQMYNPYPYSSTPSNVKIIAYGTSTSNITHFSRVADANYSNAKWGGWERLQSLGWDPYSNYVYGSALQKYN
ncbi:hypothetical protein JI735_10555 [Paenibacillus sonchi]|uniref:DUF7689 domain-containing protein n=1 Tax=Paenibacillus sonchi TaxID=373687 RepID=A0A974PG76_9BACL|nr:hypothetical protein [Paenibacillus sonchi]QQZ62916.1 hypothetical protein JI735_10555 [Paenibacillus sonchi]